MVKSFYSWLFLYCSISFGFNPNHRTSSPHIFTHSCLDTVDENNISAPKLQNIFWCYQFASKIALSFVSAFNIALCFLLYISLSYSYRSLYSYIVIVQYIFIKNSNYSNRSMKEAKKIKKFNLKEGNRKKVSIVTLGNNNFVFMVHKYFFRWLWDPPPLMSRWDPLCDK